MLGGFFMSINIENMEKPKCAKIFWQMQKQFQLTTMLGIDYLLIGQMLPIEEFPNPKCRSVSLVNQ